MVVGFSTGIISEFGLDGGFIGTPTLAPPFPVPILGIDILDGRIYYGVDVVDREGGTRTLETWRLEREHPHSLLRSDPMPDLPTFRGRAVSNVPLHAEPVWTSAGRCAFISDGSGAWVVVADLVDGGADSLRLPAQPLAERSAADLAQWARELEDARRWGIAPAGMEDVEPTARARWADLIVDPAGLLWVEPWRPPSLRDGPLTALTLNPATGEVRSVDVPRFPDAFLPGGRFVALASDDRLPVVETYVLR